jgi:hypothetical protein
LRVRAARKKAIRGGEFIGVHLIIPRLNIDNHELAFVALCNVRVHVALVNLIAAPGELVFAIA